MERHEFPVRGEAEESIAAVERGDEVMLVRDGRAVATVTVAMEILMSSPEVLALLEAREALAPLRYAGAGSSMREQRDASTH